MRRAIGLLTVVCVLALAASAAAAAAKPSLKIGDLKLSAGGLKVTLSCKGGACKGGLRLTEKPASKKSPTIVLAKGPYKVAASHQKTVTAKLTPEGQALLASLLKGKGKPVPAKLTATLIGGVTQSQTLQFP
jgi:hypothetical protein